MCEAGKQSQPGKDARLFHLVSSEVGLVHTPLRVKARILELTWVCRMTSMLTSNWCVARLPFSRPSRPGLGKLRPRGHMQPFSYLLQFRWLTTCWRKCSGSSSSSCQPPPSLRWPWCRRQDKHHPEEGQKHQINTAGQSRSKLLFQNKDMMK